MRATFGDISAREYGGLTGGMQGIKKNFHFFEIRGLIRQKLYISPINEGVIIQKRPISSRVAGLIG